MPDRTLPTLPLRVAAALVALFSAAAVVRAADPGDIVPRGDIAYDLLGSLAARNRLPGYTLADFVRGDLLLSRQEIARLLAAAFPDGPNALPVGDGRAASLRLLATRFNYELHALAPAAFPLTPAFAAARPDLAGWARARVLSDPTAGEVIGRAAGVLPLGRDAHAAVSIGDWRREWYDVRAPTGGGRYGPVETAYVRVNTRALDVTLGLQPLRWGPGFSGALNLNDAAPSLPMLHVEKSFLLPGGLRRAGRLTFQQFVARFEEPDDSTAPVSARGDARYVVARRLTARGGPWDFSASESIKTADLPDAHGAFFNPSLWLYTNDWTEGRKRQYLPLGITRRKEDSFWVNYQADLKIGYRADQKRGTYLYLDLLIDDIKGVRFLSTGSDTPQKVGRLFGVHVPRIGGENGRIGARLEYASLDPGVYTNLSRPVDWAVHGVPLGYPTGPNGRSLFARVDARFSDRARVSVEGQRVERKGTPLPGYPTLARTDRLGVYGSYALRPDAFVGLRLERGRGGVPANLTGARVGAPYRTRVELNATLGF